MKKITFENIPLKDISPDPNQPRKFYDEQGMNELTQSVRESGVFQPILVREQPNKQNKYILVCGERRYRASIAAKLKTIPAIIRELTDEQALQLQIIENLQRKDVHPMEEAVAFKSLIDNKDWNAEEVSKRIGKSVFYVRQRLKLNSLIKEFQDLYFQNKISNKTVLEIALLDSNTQKQLFEDKVDEDDLSSTNFFLELNKYQYDVYVGNLTEAPFDISDGTLNQSMGPCTACQFNSHISKLFPEEGDMKCGNISCFKSKSNFAFEKNLVAVQQNPAVVLITGQYNPDKETVALMKKIEGILDRKMYEPEDAPDHPDRDWFEGDNETEEEDEADYQKAIVEYRNDLKDYESKISSGAYVKAFIVGGSEKGKFVFVKLKKASVSTSKSAAMAANLLGEDKDVEQSVNDIEYEISRITDKEKRSKQIDQNKIWDDLRKHFSPQTNIIGKDGAFKDFERKAIAKAMYNKLAYGSAEQFRKTFKIDGRREEFPEVTYEEFVQMSRFFMLDVLPPAVLYQGYNQDALISIEVAENYFPAQLQDVRSIYNEKAEKRIKNLEKRLTELREQKKQLKSSVKKK